MGEPALRSEHTDPITPVVPETDTFLLLITSPLGWTTSTCHLLSIALSLWRIINDIEEEGHSLLIPLCLTLSSCFLVEFSIVFYDVRPLMVSHQLENDFSVSRTAPTSQACFFPKPLGTTRSRCSTSGTSFHLFFLFAEDYAGPSPFTRVTSPLPIAGPILKDRKPGKVDEGPFLDHVHHFARQRWQVTH